MHAALWFGDTVPPYFWGKAALQKNRYRNSPWQQLLQATPSTPLQVLSQQLSVLSRLPRPQVSLGRAES